MAKELEIELSDQVKQSMAEDPELEKAMREFIAKLHQAQDGVNRGQYKSMDDAMEVLTGNRPMKIDLDELLEEFENDPE